MWLPLISPILLLSNSFESDVLINVYRFGTGIRGNFFLWPLMISKIEVLVPLLISSHKSEVTVGRRHMPPAPSGWYSPLQDRVAEDFFLNVVFHVCRLLRTKWQTELIVSKCRIFKSKKSRSLPITRSYFGEVIGLPLLSVDTHETVKCHRVQFSLFFVWKDNGCAPMKNWHRTWSTSMQLFNDAVPLLKSHQWINPSLVAHLIWEHGLSRCIQLFEEDMRGLWT